jgi:hypothetical protein
MLTTPQRCNEKALKFRGIVLLLVVVLVLDLLRFCGEKGIRFPLMILFNLTRSEGETSAFLRGLCVRRSPRLSAPSA